MSATKASVVPSVLQSVAAPSAEMYQLPGSPLTDVLFGWIIRRGLNSMFTHRYRITRQVCENDKITS
jgi:hypothetical protein